MSSMLKDNTSVSETVAKARFKELKALNDSERSEKINEFLKGFEERCRAIQKLVDKGQCSLIDLLDTTGKKAQDIPQIFKTANGELWTGNLVGVFEYRTENGTVEQVIIGDRFGPKQVANDGASGEFLSPFAWAMLEKCWNDTPLWMLNEYRTNGTTSIFDQVLMLQLASTLDRAWKKGRFRIYRTFSCYDCRVRGQLDLPRKIRMSMGLEDGRMAYRVREYSEDNLYDQLFFQACLEAEKRHPACMQQLRQRMPGFRMARQTLEQQNAVWGRGDTRSLLNGTGKKITNPVYRDYETLRVIARAVLKRSSHSSYPYAENGAPFVTGIFLDISKLWEDYLYKAVIRDFSCLAQKDKGILEGMLIIRPDFWWEKEKCVLDAKYRPVWGRIWKAPSREERIKGRKDEKDPDGEDVRDDVYQVLTYMLTLDCTHGGVIFPVKRERPAAKSSADKKDDPQYKVRAVNGRSFGMIPFFVPQQVDSDTMATEATKVREELQKAFFGSK